MAAYLSAGRFSNAIGAAEVVTYVFFFCFKPGVIIVCLT